MKKLLLFLSLCVTNVVYSNDTTMGKLLGNIEEGLKNTDLNNSKAIADFADAIMKEVMKRASSSAKNLQIFKLTELESFQIVDAVKIIINRAQLAESYLRKGYELIFAYLGMIKLEKSLEEEYLRDLLKEESSKSDESRVHSKTVLRAFQLSLCWNAVFWDLLPKVEGDKQVEYDDQFKVAREILEKIYAEAVLDESSLDVFKESFEAILKTEKQEQNDNPLVSFLKEIAKEYEISCKFLKDEKQKNVPQDPPANNQEEEKKEIPQPKPNVIPANAKESFPLIPVGTVLGAAGGSYYVVEKTEYGKRLKKFTEENPKTAIALGGLAGMVVGGVVYTLNK